MVVTFMSLRVIQGSPCLSWLLKPCVNREWALWQSKRKPLYPPAELSVVLASQVFTGPCVSRLIPSLYLTLSAPGTTAQENNLSLLHELFLEHHKSQIHRGWEMLAWLVGFLAFWELGKHNWLFLSLTFPSPKHQSVQII